MSLEDLVRVVCQGESLLPEERLKATRNALRAARTKLENSTEGRIMVRRDSSRRIAAARWADEETKAEYFAFCEERVHRTEQSAERAVNAMRFGEQHNFLDRKQIGALHERVWKSCWDAIGNEKGHFYGEPMPPAPEISEGAALKGRKS